MQGPGRVRGRHSRCPTGERNRSLSETRGPDRSNTVTTSNTGIRFEPESENDLANEEETARNYGDVRHAPTAIDTTNETVLRNEGERESSSLHARGGGLSRLLRQCFGIRSPPSPVPLYTYHEHPRPRPRPRRRPQPRYRHRHRSRSRHQPRRRRRRHSSYGHSRSRQYRNDRYYSPPRHRSLSEHRPAVARATEAPNYDDMSDDELFNSILAEERAMDPMLRDVDARRGQDEEA